MTKGVPVVRGHRRPVDPAAAAGRLLVGVFALFAVLYMVAPVYIMVKVSISPPAEVLTQHPTLLPGAPTLEHWAKILQSGNLWPPLQKSFSVATLTTLFGLLIAAPGAYVLSRLPRAYRYSAVLALFFTRMFPEVGIALPIAVQFVKWNLLDTHLGLVLAHLVKTLPLAAWILVGTFETIPVDLEQAARVDGASRLQVLWKVVLPLALPGLAAAAIFVWLESWNEFTYALYLTLSERTLPLQTWYYVIRGNWFDAASYSTILTIPVFIVTFFLQRYLKTGYLTGAIKG